MKKRKNKEIFKKEMGKMILPRLKKFNNKIKLITYLYEGFREKIVVSQLIIILNINLFMKILYKLFINNNTLIDLNNFII